MKRVLPLLVMCAVLLVGCQNAEGFLDVPASPSADLPERPGFVSEPVSEETSAEESAPAVSNRDMTFLDTGTEHLYRLKTREGDLEVLGMTYGDGIIFVLSHRESGNAVTGYDTDGKGVFAGVLDEAFASPALLGYADGYACLYSASAGRTFACNTQSSYVWYDGRKADRMSLYSDGYLMVKDGMVSLIGPKNETAYTSFSIPDGAELLACNEEQALLKQDGTLVRMDTETMQSTTLSPLMNYSGGALLFCAQGQTAVYNPYSKTVHATDASRILAVGKEYIAEETSAGIRLILTETGKQFVLPQKGDFRMGARMEHGFLFAQNGEWYVLDDEAFADSSVPLLSCNNTEDLLLSAGKALCASSTGSILLAESGAPFSFSPAVAGFVIRRVDDGEVLFRSAAQILSQTQTTDISARACIYLCDSILIDTELVPYAFYRDGAVTAVLLDITDGRRLPEALQEILRTLREDQQT